MHDNTCWVCYSIHSFVLQSLQIQQGLRQITRIEQANLLEMSEEDFQKLVIDIEHTDLFSRLYRKEKLICYQRFPASGISTSFYDYKEELLADKGSFDIDSLISNKEHIIGIIQKLGMERFKYYFLLAESGMTLVEIARECDLQVTDVQAINSLVDEFSIMSEFYFPSNLPADIVRYSRVASVNMNNEGFIINYFSPALARESKSLPL